MRLNLLRTYLCATPARGRLRLDDPKTGEAIATLERLTRQMRSAEQQYLAACDPSVSYGAYWEAQQQYRTADWCLSEYLLTGRDLSQERAAYEAASAFEGAA